MRRTYISPLDLPESTIGRFYITKEIKPASTQMQVVSGKTAIFHKGQRTSVKFDGDRIVHLLVETGKGMWMSDSPEEMEEIYDVIPKLKCSVLVGGLGLGLLPKMLDDNKDVTHMTVVEKESDILDLVRPHLYLKKLNVVIQADLFDYLQCSTVTYDSAYYDIWAPTGEDILFTHISPLRHLSQGKIRQNRIHCWQEEVMLGQLAMSLDTFLLMPQSILGMDWVAFDRFYGVSRISWPFYNWYRQEKPDSPTAHTMATYYAKHYPFLSWHNKYKTWRKYLTPN